MLNFIKNLVELYENPHNKTVYKRKVEKMSDSLEKNIIYIKKEFDGSADLTIRQMKINETSMAIITIEGMINKQIFANSVLTPIVNCDFINKNSVEKYEYIRDHLLSTTEQVQVVTYDEVFSFIMSGFAVIAIDGCNCMLAIGVQGFNFRSVSEPTSEVMQR